MENRLLKDYTWVVNQDAPWKHLSKDISEAKVALITTAGLYPWKQTKHFNLADENGDPSFREIKKIITQEEIRISHKYYDLKDSVNLDFNCNFPLDRLLEMEKEKKISAVSESHFSVMGETKDPKAIINDTVPKIIKLLQKYLVDVVVITPVGALGHQTAALMAREIEEAEISTVMVSSLKTVCQNAKPPRTILVRFPFGQLFGAPFDVETQKEILAECLIHIKSIREPGEIAELNLRWRDSYAKALAAKPDLKSLASHTVDTDANNDKRKISAEKF
ncbi:hypothetical protein K1X84_00505 [bacterium]|nr:hypothetical protein [bacterium]